MGSRLELPIIDDRGKLMVLGPLITIALMYFPNDEASVDNFVTAVAANVLLDELSADDEIRRAAKAAHITEEPTFWTLIGQIKELDKLQADAEAAVTQGRAAAEVLTVALRLGGHFPRFGSVNNAVRIVCLASKRSRSSVMQDWSNYKSVAHLWIAALELGEMVIDDFPMFLGAAETLRVKAEKQKVPGARATLLSPSTTYAAPAQLNLSMMSFDFPKPDNWMIEELGAN